MKLTTLFLATSFLLCVNQVSAQEAKKEEKKIQEVVNIQADPVSLPPDADGNVPVDTSAPKGMASREI